MNKQSVLIIVIVCMLLGGCSVMEKEYVVPVQEYTRKEYLAKDKEQWNYVEEHKEVYEEYAIQWFKEKYQLDVKVNFIYPYPDTESIMSSIEWTGDNDLKMSMVMGVDKTKHKVMGVNETVMQLEVSMMSYLIRRMYEEEFHNLEEFLKEFASKYDLLGVSDEYIENRGGGEGFRSKYYRFSEAPEKNSTVISSFLDNFQISKEELRRQYENDLITYNKNDIRHGVIVIELYSKTDEINEDLYKELEKELQKQKGLPNSNYVLSLCKNKFNIEFGRAECTFYPEYPTKNGYIRIDGGV